MLCLMTHVTPFSLLNPIKGWLWGGGGVNVASMCDLIDLGGLFGWTGRIVHMPEIPLDVTQRWVIYLTG